MINGGLKTQGIVKRASKGKPLISVATVVFNGEKTIEKTINSIINQTYDNIEYIIIDGASTDDTLDIIKKYEGKIDYWQSEPDEGIYDAMNKCLDLAKGEFIIFMGCDDVFFSPYIIDVIISQIRDLNSIYYGDVFYKKSRKIYNGKFSSIKLCCCNICHQSILYPKKVYKNMKYETKYKILADWNYNLTSWNKYDFNYIPLVISIYNDEGRSQTEDRLFNADHHKIIKKNFGFLVYVIYIFISIAYKIKLSTQHHMLHEG